ncbi:hypothetical protein [Marispirochaeta aestuarii]|uniref:hypothetical protein n=1 Tax=Marispirochaeta aestuarii TaxID=1963862 RepID=UPI002ABDE572|nr:hypothetical protein [Marispirochaeta aestuarii]
MSDQLVGRTRGNIKQTSKGAVQIDVTAEYATPEEMAENIGKSIDLLRDVCARKGLQIVSE